MASFQVSYPIATSWARSKLIYPDLTPAARMERFLCHPDSAQIGQADLDWLLQKYHFGVPEFEEMMDRVVQYLAWNVPLGYITRKQAEGRYQTVLYRTIVGKLNANPDAKEYFADTVYSSQTRNNIRAYYRLLDLQAQKRFSTVKRSVIERLIRWTGLGYHELEGNNNRDCMIWSWERLTFLEDPNYLTPQSLKITRFCIDVDRQTIYFYTCVSGLRFEQETLDWESDDKTEFPETENGVSLLATAKRYAYHPDDLVWPIRCGYRYRERATVLLPILVADILCQILGNDIRGEFQAMRLRIQAYYQLSRVCNKGSCRKNAKKIVALCDQGDFSVCDLRRTVLLWTIDPVQFWQGCDPPINHIDQVTRFRIDHRGTRVYWYITRETGSLWEMESNGELIECEGYDRSQECIIHYDAEYRRSASVFVPSEIAKVMRQIPAAKGSRF